MKKILFFCSSMQMGGMEKALVNLLNVLVDYYDTTLVLESKTGILLNHLNEAIKIIEYKPSKFKNSVLRKIHNGIKRFIWLLKNKNKYDFACNYATYSLLGSRLSQIASKNNALYVHNNYYDMYDHNEKAIRDFFDQHKVDKFEKIIFVSTESLEGVKKVLPGLDSKMIVINNIVDYKKIISDALEKPNDLVFKDENINFLYVGRLDNVQKDLELMINSFSMACRKKKNLMLYMIGDGPYKNDLIKIIKKSKLDKKVVLFGQKENPYYYIKNCDCILFTSKYEGFPVTYCEALILNQKVLTTIPVNDGCIDARDYFAIVENNSDAIAKEMIKVTKEKPSYKIDYEVINSKNFKKIERLIEKE